ncbi:MAG: hypothetical protein PHG19_04060 [Anaerotignum sp.]|nr:hypothetical protein [Anaerotignum sp.]
MATKIRQESAECVGLSQTICIRARLATLNLGYVIGARELWICEEECE